MCLKSDDAPPVGAQWRLCPRYRPEFFNVPRIVSMNITIPRVQINEGSTQFDFTFRYNKISNRGL